MSRAWREASIRSKLLGAASGDAASPAGADACRSTQMKNRQARRANSCSEQASSWGGVRVYCFISARSSKSESWTAPYRRRPLMPRSGELVRKVRMSWIKDISHRQRTRRRLSRLPTGCRSAAAGCAESSNILLELSNHDGLDMREMLPDKPAGQITRSTSTAWDRQGTDSQIGDKLQPPVALQSRHAATGFYHTLQPIAVHAPFGRCSPVPLRIQYTYIRSCQIGEAWVVDLGTKRDWWDVRARPTSNVRSRMTAAKTSSLRAVVGSFIHNLTMRTASALYLRASLENLMPRIRDRCAAACAMMALKDAAFDRSKGNQTSRIGLKVSAVSSSNIMVAWVLSPGARH